MNLLHGKHPLYLVFGWMLTLGLCAFPASAHALRSLQECSCLEDDGERLRCYDQLAGVENIQKTIVENATCGVEPFPAPIVEEEESYLSQLWELDESEPRGRFVLMPHRENYILPVSYNESPNRQPDHTGDSTNVKETEVKFQLSVKVKLWQDVLDQDMDLWFGYTQKSFWQLYDVEDSSPFRETNYEPEMLLNYRTDISVLGMRLRTVALGFNHQSNGRSEPLSRSWNRVVANLGLENDDFVVQLKTWYRIPESDDDDDNPRMERYMGPGELWAWYFWGTQRFGVMWRNNFHLDDNRGALQLEWAFPLGRKVSGYVQYFTGYGESLLDYDHPVDRIGIGFILDDWN